MTGAAHIHHMKDASQIALTGDLRGLLWVFQSTITVLQKRPTPSDCRGDKAETLVNVDHAPLQWRHNGRDSVSNHQPHECLLNRLIRCRSKKTSKLRTTGLCAGNSPGTNEFPAQMASYAENVSIWWRHAFLKYHSMIYTHTAQCHTQPRQTPAEI